MPTTAAVSAAKFNAKIRAVQCCDGDEKNPVLPVEESVRFKAWLEYDGVRSRLNRGRGCIWGWSLRE